MTITLSRPIRLQLEFDRLEVDPVREEMTSEMLLEADRSEPQCDESFEPDSKVPAAVREWLVGEAYANLVQSVVQVVVAVAVVTLAMVLGSTTGMAFLSSLARRALI